MIFRLKMSLIDLNIARAYYPDFFLRNSFSTLFSAENVLYFWKKDEVNKIVHWFTRIYYLFLNGHN